MKLAVVIGNGCLGHGLAFHLSQSAIPTRLMGRTGSVTTTVSVIDQQETKHAFQLPVFQASDLAKTGIVFFAVKAFQLADAIKQHAPLFPTGTPLVSLSNGAIDELLDLVSEQFPKFRLRLGISTLAVTQEGPEQYRLANKSPTTAWGPFRPVKDGPSELEQTIASLPTFQWDESPIGAYRKKWLFNTTLNTITAVDRLRKNGDVLRRRQMLMMVFAEAYSLGEENWGVWEEAPEVLFGQLLQLVEATSENQNSMSKDVREGRRTETEFLAGLAHRFEGYPILKELDEKLH